MNQFKTCFVSLVGATILHETLIRKLLIFWLVARFIAFLGTVLYSAKDCNWKRHAV